MADYEFTLNLSIVCATALIALFMLRSTVRSVASRKYFIFDLRLPFDIRWNFIGGDDANQVNAIAAGVKDSRSPLPGMVGSGSPPQRELDTKSQDSETAA